MPESKMDNCRETCKMQNLPYLVIPAPAYSRYGARVSNWLQISQIRFRSLHNAVYIRYVHNQQIFTNFFKNVEFHLFLRYSMYRKLENVEIFQRNRIICGLHHCGTQDVVFPKTEAFPS